MRKYIEQQHQQWLAHRDSVLTEHLETVNRLLRVPERRWTLDDMRAYVFAKSVIDKIRNQDG